jgi:hypothetical protein
MAVAKHYGVNNLHAYPIRLRKSVTFLCDM